jgi:uncharacterized protein
MSMEVEDDVLERLLALQSEDTEIARLRDRRAALPEAARLAEVDDTLAELDGDLGIARGQNEEATREQSRIEGEIELLDQKLQREEGRLFSGAVSNPKELSALQAEVEMLKRNRSSLEDGLLEVMVRKDQLAENLVRLESDRAAAQAESDALNARVSGLTAEIDSALKEHDAGRSEAAGGIPAKVLSLYERIRDQKHGVGAAALENGTCTGCHTRLPSREVERLKSERGLQRCDNCRRILVVR